MRLLIIGINFAPEPIGVGKYSGEMAAWFAARGHDISVITTRPYYPEWKKAPAPGRWFWRSETWRGCRVVRCPLYVRDQLKAGARIVGPALVQELGTTTVLFKNDECRVMPSGELIIRIGGA